MIRLGKNAFGLQARDNQDTLIKMSEAYGEFYNNTLERFERSEKAFKYLMPDSGWDEDLKAELLNAGVPALSINILLPRALRILGQELKIRDEIKFVPPIHMQDGTPGVANTIFEWIESKQGLSKRLARVFAYALIGDLGGYGEWVWDTTEDPRGVPCFEDLSSFYVFRDTRASIQKQRQWRFIGKSWWMTPEEIYAEFPEKEDEIREALRPVDQTHEYSVLSDQLMGYDGAYINNREIFVDTKNRMYRIIEMQEKVQKKKIVAENRFNGNIKVLESRDEAVFINERFPDMFKFDSKFVDRIYTHTSVGDYVHIDTQENEVQNGMFSILGMEGIEFGEANTGLITQGLDMQEGYNKARTAILHIMHSIATSGWMYEDGSLDEEMMDIIHNQGARTGLALRYKNGHQKPEKILPNTPPNAEYMQAQSYNDDLTKITSIGDDQLGQQQYASQAAALNEQKVQNSMTTLEPLFESFKDFKKRVGQYGWELCKAMITGPRLIEFVDQNKEAQRIILNQVSEGRKLNEVAGNFHVIVVAAQDTQTQRRLKFAEASQMAAVMPPDLVYWPYMIETMEFIPPDTREEWKQHIYSRMGPPPEQIDGLLQQLSDGATAASAPMPGNF